MAVAASSRLAPNAAKLSFDPDYSPAPAEGRTLPAPESPTRENRLYGSERGRTEHNRSSLSLSVEVLESPGKRMPSAHYAKSGSAVGLAVG